MSCQVRGMASADCTSAQHDASANTSPWIGFGFTGLLLARRFVKQDSQRLGLQDLLSLQLFEEARCFQRGRVLSKRQEPAVLACVWRAQTRPSAPIDRAR